MPAVNPTCYHLSASAIAAFKKCPTAFRLAYREGLRPDTDTESQRMGTNWHALHECYANAYKKAADASVQAMDLNLSAEECADLAMQAVVNLLNERYDSIPTSKTPAEWALERTVLLVSFIGYHWYWQNDPIEVLASEVPFNLPLHMPKIGMPLPMSEVQRVGKIDHIIRWQGMVGVLERKSTSRSIDPESDYWDKSRKDTQVSMYAAAFRDLIASGAMAEVVNHRPLPLKEGERMPSVGSTLYDVFHKPTIKPKMLTQADTAKFIETGVYFDQKFRVEVDYESDDTTPESAVVRVDGMTVEVDPGKRGFAIRESVGMYGARLLADIYERPDFYFARREIARTDADVEKFRGELYAHYRNMKLVEKYGTWTENESQCRATFPCPYIGVCYGPGADKVCDGHTTPNGYKRIFVDLTREGQAIAEEE